MKETRWFYDKIKTNQELNKFFSNNKSLKKNKIKSFDKEVDKIG